MLKSSSIDELRARYSEFLAKQEYADLALVADFITDALFVDWYVSAGALRSLITDELNRRDLEVGLSADDYAG